MDAKEAIDIGMKIAEHHTAVALSIFRVKPDATAEEALRGTQVWLSAEIMKELQAAAGEHDFEQMRAALEEIREKAPMMKNGASWAAGLAMLCLGTLTERLKATRRPMPGYSRTRPMKSSGFVRHTRHLLARARVTLSDLAAFLRQIRGEHD